MNTSARLRGWAKIGAVIFLAFCVAFYRIQPFLGVGNSIVLNSFPVIGAVFTAVLATLIWRRFEQTETPHRIWRCFAIGLWSWVTAELIWGGLDLLLEDVSVGFADVFWVAGYIFFARALFMQYRLLASPSKRELWSRMSIAIVILVAFYMLIYRLLSTWTDAESQWSLVVNSFYPIGDLFLAGIAIGLVRHFGGGAFARPWLGLLAFVFTDLLYAMIEISDMYAWSLSLRDVFDLAYIGAYLILGLGLFSQWVFLKYGLRAPTQPQ
jgi:hypothetical protein